MMRPNAKAEKVYLYPKPCTSEIQVSQANPYDLIGMWVEPTARGSGVATQLVEAVKPHAIEQGHDRVFLDVSPDNARASHFYLN